MFRTSSGKFRWLYYMSSLFPTYVFLIIMMIFYKAEKNHSFAVIHIFKGDILYIMVFVVVLLLGGYSLRASIKALRMIKDQTNYSSSIGTIKARILPKYNTGYREFFLSFIVPMISTFSIVDNPITTISLVIFFQLISYNFFKNSSDFFPNITLIIFGYSVFEVKSTSCKNLKYALGKTKDIDKLTFTEVEVVALGSDSSYDNVGVIVNN